MSEPFVGEIRMFAGNFAPRAWAFCDGQLLAVSQNDALFSLLGTIYGGDGRTTFGLPDMRGRIPVHAGTGPGLSPYRIGQKAGTENITLTVSQIPPHNHTWNCTETIGTLAPPSGNGYAQTPTSSVFNAAASPDSKFSGSMIQNKGGSGSHTNMMPFLCVNFIIALYGIYPSRN